MFAPVKSVAILGTDPPGHVLDRNIALNIEANYPRLHERKDWGKWKGRPLAIVAGGPSLRKSLPAIYENFADVMVCGTAHDHVVRYGIDPTYSVQCDGSKMALDFVQSRVPGTQYLIASCCDPQLFDNGDVWMWHCLGSGSIPHQEPSIAGGCTVTLRAINIAILLGYYDLHIFGMDSCFSDVEAQHAYEYQEDDINRNTFTVRIGEEGGREFLTNSVFVAQAQHFQEMCRLYGHMFNPTVHGDGLIAEIMKVANRES